jgi:hypothetical protein
MEQVMMYSNNKKKLFLALVIFVVFSSLVNAQTQIPISMIEEMMQTQFFSHVPKTEFHRVFVTFTQERYQGRDFLYQSEIKDFSASFALYVATKESFKNYKPAEPPKTAANSPPQFPTTHRLTADLKLFTDQDGGSEVITTLKKGSGVQVLEYGGYADMDGITAKWAHAKTSTGETGWLFSGYLEDAPK